MRRCAWADSNPLLAEYHDQEWGTPLHDDRKQFEFISLEVMQCGLSWLTVLKKREVFKEAFADFDVASIAGFDESNVDAILGMEHMIKSRRKVEAIIRNARSFLKIQEEFGSFDRYIWQFTEGKTLEYPGHAEGSVIIARNELSDAISADLKKRGFSFLGSITVYAHLQAAGIINDHLAYCFRYQQDH
ncbi:MAG: DNA-3-methyladenine glycosylase I [Sphaerochaeta sp.]|uniref:DNA-3-methyladenine glycosylase I n=1 Tax=Sphaerochaeta sp. TaxID=1972642 RepID=UPI002FC5B4CF